MDGGGEAEHGSGDNGEEANGRGKEGRGKTGLKGWQCRFERGEPTRAEVTPARGEKGEKKRKRRERKGLAPLPIREKEEGAGRLGRGRGALCLRPLEASARSGGGLAITTAMTAGRFGAARRHGRQARAGAAEGDGGGDRAA
uniref:Epstein-Barr virus EBNA-1-like protein n=1 Tax=Oryza sativa subsp. japonica TaxID=39947 RepID=Q6YTF2_ORYSJ|nr:Epstein-Barr virus EBNA-1-like protein [Oryza sativa Japonica Group]